MEERSKLPIVYILGTEDDNLNKDNKNPAYPLAGMIPPEILFGKDASDKEAMMKLMTSDEIIEELQKLAYQSNGSQKRMSPEDKENFKDLGKIHQLETRLKEVTKENKTLIDELQDK